MGHFSKFLGISAALMMLSVRWSEPKSVIHSSPAFRRIR